MKLKTKDEIITCLIQILSNPISEYDKGYLVDKGWIEALKWVLGLNDRKQEIFNEGKNTLVVKEREKNE